MKHLFHWTICPQHCTHGLKYKVWIKYNAVNICNSHLRPSPTHTNPVVITCKQGPYIDFDLILSKAKKKNTLSQSLREFFKPTWHAVFYFLFYFFFTSIGLCLHAHPKPKMTEKFQLPYFTRFLSSHVLKFFQNSKLSSFFVVKMKKNYFKKKKMKVWILQNQMRTEKQMRAAALRHRFFFFF